MNKRNLFRISATVAAMLALALVTTIVQRAVHAAPPAGTSITGTIKLEGTAPHQRPIDMSKEPSCAAVHKASPVTTETVVAGADGGLKNVVVYISDGLSGAATTEVASETPTWDQKGCQYIPHVMALNPNEHFKVTNSDPTSHNIHPMPQPGGQNHEWNKSQPSGAQPLDAVWQAPEVAIHVKCNIHPWMSGYMVVVKGPYGVSDEKGSFKIENVPPGTYTLTAWQESLGTQAQKITVAAGKPSTANFSFKAK
jgi:Polysaccharide lyase family 4, domain II